MVSCSTSGITTQTVSMSSLKRSQKYSTALFWAYVLVIWSFLLPNLINSASIIILAAFATYGAITKQFKFSGYSLLVLYPLLFVYIAVGYFYSENSLEALKIIERHLSLLFLPLILQSSSVLSSSQKEKLEGYFIASLVAIGLFCISVASYISIKNGSIYIPTARGHFIYNYFMHHRLTAPTGLHAIFLSFYFSFANLLILNRLLFNATSLTKQKKAFYIIAFVFICLLLFLLKSANFAFIFPVACLALVVFKIRKKLASTKVKLLFFTLLVATLSFSYVGVKTKLDSFSTSYDLSDPYLRPLAIRLGIWECTWELIEEDILFGLGTGDGHDALLKKYEEKDFYIGYTDKFNAHNMFLQYGLSNGLLASLLFIAILLSLLFKALKYKNIPMLCFIVLFAFFSITESTMLKQKGLVFFVFFTSLFYWNPSLWNKNTTTTE